MAVGGLGALGGALWRRLGSLRNVGLLSAVALLTLAAGARADTRTYLLGDKDGIHYDGPGSVDDIYVNPANIAYLQAVAAGEPNDDLDVLNYNNNVPFTFV